MLDCAPRRRPRPATLLVLFALCAGPALAHDFWIVPAQYAPQTGELLAVHLRVGDHALGEPVARRDERIVAFVLAGTGTGADAPPASAVVGRDGALPAGLVRLTQAGPHVLGYRGNRAWLELEATAFEAYLREEGLLDVLAARAAAGTRSAPGREVYSRCAKALLDVRASDAAADAAGGSAAARSTPAGAPPDRLLGFPLELLAESDPRTLAQALPDGTHVLAPFRVRLLHEGRPLAGALVEAALFVSDVAAAGAAPPGAALPFEAPAGTGLHARTDAEGYVSFALPRPGTWLITAVHMVAAPPGTQPDALPGPPAPAPAVADSASAVADSASAVPDAVAPPADANSAATRPDALIADWESLWASLSFEVPAAPVAR